MGLRTELHRATSATVIVIFILSIISPAYLVISGTYLTFSRVLLLIFITPLLVRLLLGRAGPLMRTDYLILLYSAWIAITYTFHYGTTRVALSGITIIEQLGAYLVGRVLIRNSTDYTIVIRTFFISILILLPFSILELLTGRNLWAELFDLFVSVRPKDGSAYGRMGLERVTSGFEHPILYGLFCSLGLANLFYFSRSKVKAIAAIIFVSGMTFMSLSSAPLMAVGSQALMITWDKITKGRWILLSVLIVAAYVTIDALSNRTPVTILISTLTFNPLSAWTRVSIWDYGSAAVLANPIMGIGLGDWPRPFWLTSSVDNFWLLISMRHGFPAIGLLLAALLFHLIAILRAKNLPPTLARYRTGYVLALLCLYFTLCTVHIWGATSSFVFFYIGAGLWFVGAGEKVSEAMRGPVAQNVAVMLPESGAAAPQSTRFPSALPDRSPGLPQSRFPSRHKRGDRED